MSDPESLVEGAEDGNELARRLQQRHNYWWDVGKCMADRGLSPTEAREAIELSGHVLMKTRQSLYRMHRTYKRLREAGIFEVEVQGCPMTYARTCAEHFEEGRIDLGGLRTLLTARSCRVGQAPDIFSKVKDDPHSIIEKFSPDD